MLKRVKKKKKKSTWFQLFLKWRIGLVISRWHCSMMNGFTDVTENLIVF